MTMDDNQLLTQLTTLSRLRRSGSVDALPLDDMLETADRLDRELLESSLHEFVRAAWSVIEPGKEFVDGWHVRAICEHLERVARGELLRLVILVPPRSSKSTIVSVSWPAWMWAKKPSLQWMCVSNSDRLAIDHSRKMRTLVASPWYQGMWHLPYSRDQNAKTRFDNDESGYRLALTIRSAGTGLGGDILVIDDPHDRDEAMSDVERRACIDAYREKFSTRLNDPNTGAIVAIGQRLHTDDLFGYLLKQGFDVLTIPMRYESNHPTPSSTGWIDPRTQNGELLCPRRFSEAYAKEQESVLGSWGFAGQYQQRPTVRGGGMFKQEWFQIVKVSPAKGRRVRYWDKASSDEAGSCYTAGVKMSEVEGVYYIEHVIRRRVGPDARRRLMKIAAALDAKRDESTEQVIEREGGSTGKDAVLDEVRLLAGYIVHHHKPVGSKDVRLEPLAAQFEAGNVKLVEGEWNQEFIDELMGVLAGGKYRDCGDAAAGAFAWLRRDELSNEIALSQFMATDDEQIRKPFSAEEVEQLPDYLRELVEGHADLAKSNRFARRGRYGDEF